MEEVFYSHLAPLPVVLSASTFLRDTNFVVVFQVVCKEWRRWCKKIEDKYAMQIWTPPQLVSKNYVRSIKIKTVFPCATYTSIQNLTASASISSRDRYLDREYCVCFTCRNWVSKSNMYRLFANGDLEEQCIRCAAHKLCTSCSRNRRHPSGDRCLTCVMRGSFFPGARFRLPVGCRL